MHLRPEGCARRERGGGRQNQSPRSLAGCGPCGRSVPSAVSPSRRWAGSCVWAYIVAPPSSHSLLDSLVPLPLHLFSTTTLPLLLPPSPPPSPPSPSPALAGSPPSTAPKSTPPSFVRASARQTDGVRCTSHLYPSTLFLPPCRPRRSSSRLPQPTPRLSPTVPPPRLSPWLPSTPLRRKSPLRKRPPPVKTVSLASRPTLLASLSSPHPSCTAHVQRAALTMSASSSSAALASSKCSVSPF